ncbi:MAG: phosphoribosylamine--glycine ligase [Sandaracinaceae bacterium]|nr:phosphoribosylamine--glycine ligase [Sandaracinaceae bacterium]
MKVLVVGNGAREHALAAKLAASPGVDEVLAAPGNAGTARVGKNLALAATDVRGIVEAARSQGAGLVVVGPEAPLAAGMVDALREAGVPAFGPTLAAACLESSKAFAKDFMKRHGIPTAAYGAFDDAEAAIAFVRERGEPMVVKADGLAAGKGVVVASSVEQSVEAIRAIMIGREHGEAGARVVVEELLRGPEISYHVVSDGERYVPLAAAQDHKRLLDGGPGPEHGRDGRLLAAAHGYARGRARHPRAGRRAHPGRHAQRGRAVLGALFVGLMLVGGEPRVLEYNVRFGDPETEVLVARWDGDVLPLLLGSARGDLRGVTPRWGAPAALCVVMASAGYPASSEKGRPIEGIEAASALEGVAVYEAGTAIDGGRTVTSGGRVLAVTATGADVDEAARRAYAGVARVRFEGAQHRSDIGWQARSR